MKKTKLLALLLIVCLALTTFAACDFGSNNDGSTESTQPDDGSTESTQPDDGNTESTQPDDGNTETTESNTETTESNTETTESNTETTESNTETTEITETTEPDGGDDTEPDGGEDTYPAPSEGLEFTSNSNGTCYVSGIGTCKDNNIVIPAKSPAGDSVTSIGDYAFSGCASLTSITIPDSVKRIGNLAFIGCDSLTSITIPDSVTSIRIKAFSYCDNLTSITVDANNANYKSIDGNLYSKDGKTLIQYSIGKSDKSFTIPDGVTSIDYGAFADCDNLTSITIPDSVTSIGDEAFRYCSSLTSFIIPDSVTSIGDYAFYCCSSLTSITIPDSVTSIGYEAFYGCDNLTSFIIPDSVTSIGDKAFYGCSSLTSITISDSVTSIGDYAFSDCTGLTSITIPDSVTSIGDYAFLYCSSLTSIAVDKDNEYYMSKNGNLYSKDGKILVQYAIGKTDTDFTIPDGVTSIGYGAFADCDNLTSITIPDNVTSIGGKAFRYCSSLTSFIIPDSVTSIGDYAFYCCSSLTSITIPDSVTSIGYEAFRYCSSLTSITLPDSVTSIGDEAFGGCTGLTSITLPDSVTIIGQRMFASCESLTSITIPSGVTSIEFSAFSGCYKLETVYYTGSEADWAKIIIEDWGNDDLINANIIYNEEDTPTEEGTTTEEGHPTPSKGLEFVSNGDGTCYVSGIGSCKDTDVIIPSTSPAGYRVTSIGYSAFDYCDNLTSITIPDSVTSIGEWAFAGCSSLTSITIPGSVTSIGDWVFYDCSSLTSVEIPDSITSIGKYAFSFCTSLTSIVIPDSVTSIGNGAFYCCWRLTSATIPDSVTSIGNGAFVYCYSLTGITVDEANAYYKSMDGNLYNNDGETLIQYAVGKTATSFVIPDSVTNIGDYAFGGCYSLENILIPHSVTDIGEEAFALCYSLTSIEIPDSVTSIGDRAFNDCYSLTGITVDEANEYYKSMDGNLYSNDGKTFIRYAASKNDTSFVIPDSVTNIASSAFDSCSNLASIVIPEGVTSIGNFAFNGCSNITSIVIPDSVTSIGYEAFYYCLSLENVTIGNSVTSIGEYAFWDCTSLTSIVIPKGVTSIDCGAFYGCETLKTVYYTGSEAEWAKINIDLYNDDLTNANIIYNYVPEVPSIGNIQPYLMYQTELYAEWFEVVFVNSSNTYADKLYSDLSAEDEFLAKIAAWEIAHIAIEPSHTLESGWISKKDIYKLLIYDMLGGSSSSEELANLYDTVDNEVLNYIYDFIKDCGLAEIEDLKNCDTSDYTEHLQNTFGNIEKLDDILGHFDCLYDAVYACAQYQAFANMDTAFRNVLMAIYNDSDNPEDLREAAKECIECYEAGVQDVLTQIIAGTAKNEFKYMMSELMDTTWETMLSLIPGGKALLGGAKGIRLLADSLFSLDDRNEAYYQLEANVLLERALLRVLPDLYNDYIYDYDEMAASTYMRAIDMYKCATLFGFDYSVQLLEVRSSSANVSDDELSDYNNLIEEIKAYKTAKQENFNVFEEMTFESYQNYCSTVE